MQGKFQQFYRVSKEVAQNSLLTGSIQLSGFTRLCSLVMTNEATINISIEFLTSKYQHPSIKGHVETELLTECQRCLAPMVHPINLDFDLLIDASDEDVHSFQVDTVFTDDGYVNIFEVIEDELILALPLISIHEDVSCNEHWQSGSNEEPVVEKNNPFAVLQSLKGK